MERPDPSSSPEESSVVAAELAPRTIAMLQEVMQLTGAPEGQLIADGIGLLHLVETYKAEGASFEVHLADGRVFGLDL